MTSSAAEVLQVTDKQRNEIPRDLGEPVSVHPPAGWLRFVDQWMDAERIMPCVLAIFFTGLSIYFIWLHLNGRVPDGFPPFVMPVAAAAVLLIGIGSAALGWRAVQKPPKVIDRPGYTIYEDALVIKLGEAVDVLRWSNITELLSPAATGGKFRLIYEDGRAFDITRDVEDGGKFIESMIQRVAAEKLPAALAALSNHETVMFGKFGVRQDGLCYKDKQIDWSEVSSLLVVIRGGSSTLQVRKKGSLLPWCSVDPNLLPNNELLGQLLIRVAPAELLKQN